MPKKQLLISKYLFSTGERTFDIVDPIACGLAISLFQDAVEILVWTIAKKVDAAIKDKDPFTKIWDSIPDAKNNTKNLTLPFKANIFELNTARVNFKHYGNLPDPSDATKFLGYTREFLRESVKTFFNVDFDKISMADLISNKDVQTKIKEGERCLAIGKLDDSLRLCAEAELIASEPIYKIIPKIDHWLSDAGNLFEREKVNAGRRVFRYIAEYMDALRSACVINTIGTNLPDYLRFRGIVPKVFQAMDGTFSSTSFRTRPPSVEDVKFCIEYVINYAICVQNKLSFRKGPRP